MVERRAIPLGKTQIATVLSELQTGPGEKSSDLEYSLRRYPGKGLVPYSHNSRHDLHWEKDYETAAEVGHRLRISVEQVKIEDEGPGKVNQAAMEEYRGRVQHGYDVGLEFVDICTRHFDMPIWAREYGGLSGKRMPEIFGGYVREVLNGLGPVLRNGTRINLVNEAPTEIVMTLAEKLWYQNEGNSFGGKFLDMFKMLLISAAMVREGERENGAYEEETGKRFDCYSAVQHTPIIARHPIWRDKLAAKLADGLQNQMPFRRLVTPQSKYVNMTYYRLVTAEYCQFVADHNVINESPENAGCANDFDLGPMRFNGSDQGIEGMLSRNGWPTDPEGLAMSIAEMRRLFPDKKVIIGENGFVGSLESFQRKDKHGEEVSRAAYLISHLAMAVLEGVEEYGIWSLLDNNEFGVDWLHFGILAVDYNDPNLKRTPRSTYYVLKEIKRSREINLDKIYQVLADKCGFEENDFRFIDEIVLPVFNRRQRTINR